MAETLRELRTAMIWAAFDLGLILARRPVWSFLLFGPNLTLEDLLSLRCFSLPTGAPVECATYPSNRRS